jgi:Phospholipase A2-like domain
VLSDLLINKVKNQAPVKTMEDMTKMVKLFKVGLKNKKEGIPKGSISNVGTTNQMKEILFQKGTGVIDTLANTLLSTKENKLLPGEKHQMIKMPDGRIAPAVFSGPGTNLETRIRRGDKPLSYVDKTAEAHDIRYQLATNEADIKKADADMIKNLDKAKADNLDNLFNIRQAELIKAKYLLQDKFGMPTSWFTSFGLNGLKDKSLIPVMADKLKELEQQGFGRRTVKNKLNK